MVPPGFCLNPCMIDLPSMFSGGYPRGQQDMYASWSLFSDARNPSSTPWFISQVADQSTCLGLIVRIRPQIVSRPSVVRFLHCKPYLELESLPRFQSNQVGLPSFHSQSTVGHGENSDNISRFFPLAQGSTNSQEQGKDRHLNNHTTDCMNASRSKWPNIQERNQVSRGLNNENGLIGIGYQSSHGV